MDEKKLIPLIEVRRRLNISKSTLWKWVKDGKMKVIKLSERKVYIEEDELNRFIEESRR